MPNGNKKSRREKKAPGLPLSPAYAATDRPDQGRDAPRLVFRIRMYVPNVRCETLSQQMFNPASIVRRLGNASYLRDLWGLGMLWLFCVLCRGFDAG